MGAEGEGREPLHDFDVLNAELAKYSETLSQKPQVVAANKLDLPDAQARLGPFTEALRERGIRVYPVSCATGEGMQALIDAVAEVLFTGRTDKLHVEPPPKPKAAASARQAAGKVAGKAPAKAAASKRALAPVKKGAVAKKAVAKKGAAAKRPVAKKGAVAKRPVAKKAAVSRKPVAKKAARKAPAKSAVKKAASRKPVKKSAKKAGRSGGRR
jgi:GTP-binding protein